MGRWALAIKNVFLPQFCKQCGVWLLTEENGYFCPTCWEGSPRIERPFCTMCGRPHAGMVGFGSLSNYPCSECRARPNRYIGAVRAPAHYDAAIGHAVRLLKFRGRERLAAPLAELMREFAAAELDCSAYDALVPVPLHPVRARARGFNQSELLARGAAPAFPQAVLDASLKRIRPTHAQSRLSGEARRANVRGAFAVVGDSLGGRRVLLIDDVVTTAETVTECARALRRAGASAVDVLCAALTVSRQEY